MNKIDIITESNLSFEKTLDLSNLLGKRILAKSGAVIGRVSKIKLKPETMNLDGIIIRRGIFAKKIYVGRSYIDRLSDDAVILNINPSPLLRGKKIVNSDGKVIGKVVVVKRKDNSNDFQSLIAKSSSIIRGEFIVNFADIKSLGYSIILKPSYNAPKNYFWNRPR